MPVRDRLIFPFQNARLKDRSEYLKCQKLSPFERYCFRIAVIAAQKEALVGHDVRCEQLVHLFPATLGKLSAASDERKTNTFAIHPDARRFVLPAPCQVRAIE